MEFRVLAIGDVTSEEGTAHLRRHLPGFKKMKGVDFTVINGENISGTGLTPQQADDLFAAGADVITLGNHTWNRIQIADFLEDDRYIGEKEFPALIPTEQFHAAQERRKEMCPEYKQTPAQKELRKLCGGIVPDSVARKVLKILNQVVDDPQLIKIESSGVPTTEDIRQRRLELDKLLQTPPVDEEIARQKAMELAVLTLVSVEMEEYEAHRLRSIFGKQAKMRELDANLLRQSVRKITYGSKTVKVLLKNNQVLEECDDA